MLRIPLPAMPDLRFALLGECFAGIFFNDAFSKENGVKRTALPWGCGGDASPHKAQRRHRGARSAIASAMSDLCKIAEFAEISEALFWQSCAAIVRFV